MNTYCVLVHDFVEGWIIQKELDFRQAEKHREIYGDKDLIEGTSNARAECATRNGKDKP